MPFRLATPLLLPAAGWVAGLAMARLESVPFTISLLVAMAAFLLLIMGRFRRVAALLLAGIVWGTGALLLDAWRVTVDPSWTAGQVGLQATVEQVSTTPTYRRLRLSDVERSDGARLHGLIDLYIFGHQPLPLAGQQVTLTTTLRLPRSAMNPGAFDYAGYCFDRHIALTGALQGGMQISDARISWLERMRQRIRTAIAPLPLAEGGVLRALLLAERDTIPVPQYEAFAATGAAHLLAISGLHIGMVAAWGFAIAWWLLTRREAWIVVLPVRRVALSIGMVLAVAYATLAGWPLTTQRAVLMLAAAVAAWWLRARYAPLNILLAALMLILLWDPAAVASISLWLSFIAAGALLAVFAPERGQERPKRDWRSYLAGLFWVSLVAGLATLPLIATVFGRLPLWSLPANLLLVPLYGGLVLPLALLGAAVAAVGGTTVAVSLFALAGDAIAFGNSLMEALHHWPGGNLWLPDVPAWSGWFYGGGALLALWLWRRQQPRDASAAFVAMLLCWLAVVVPERPPAEPLFTAWDVGQGAASSLILPDGSTLLVDAPGRPQSRYNGGTTMAAGLRQQGMTHADVLLLSHAQSDHAGGTMRLLDQLRSVHELWLADVPANHRYPPMLAAARRVTANGGAVRWLARGDRLKLGEASVEVLWPPRHFAPANDNNSSLVCTLQLPSGQRLLLPGDMERPVEEALLAQEIGRHELLLVPHHGSSSSSSRALLARLKPQLAIVQSGRHNRYHFPAAVVVQRYRAQGAALYNTADGAVTLLLPEGGDVRVQQYQLQQGGKRNTALQWVQASL